MKMDLVNAGASVAGNRQYREWVKSLKAKIRRAQAKAAVRVNVELLRLYWGMGRDIAEKRMEAEYGSGFFGSMCLCSKICRKTAVLCAQQFNCDRQRGKRDSGHGFCFEQQKGDQPQHLR